MSRTAIVQAAVLIADQQGLDAVTIRDVGAHLGAKAMALYRYVSGREELLDAMVAATMDQLAPLLSPRTCPAPSAKAYLESTARGVRDLALQHRWLIRLMVLRAPRHAWMSPPLSGVACTTSVLETLTLHGYDLPASVQTYRDLCAFLLGHLLIEIPHPRGVSASTRRPGPPLPHHQPRDPPLIDQANGLTHPDLSAEFERSLSAFLRSAAAQAQTTVPTFHPGAHQ